MGIVDSIYERNPKLKDHFWLIVISLWLIFLIIQIENIFHRLPDVSEKEIQGFLIFFQSRGRSDIEFSTYENLIQTISFLRYFLYFHIFMLVVAICVKIFSNKITENNSKITKISSLLILLMIFTIELWLSNAIFTLETSSGSLVVGLFIYQFIIGSICAFSVIDLFVKIRKYYSK